MSTYSIYRRRWALVNTDPQRRCYTGCNAREELQCGQWEELVLEVPEERLESSLKFWRELNDYAVSQRGEGARVEYKAVAHGANWKAGKPA